jgi:twinkle protein
MQRTWTDFGIDTKGHTTGEFKTVCPACSAHRKKKHYPCLNLNLDKGVWHCWHCEWSGTLGKGEDRRSNPYATPLIFRKPVYRQTALPQRVVDWFATREIPEKILARNRISYGPVYMPQVEQEVPAIQFPYFRNGEVVNVKYRDGRKFFRMSGGAERILYGLDDIAGSTVLICEGEIDKLSLEVAGYTSVVSVPDGAPAPDTKHYEHKFDFLLSAEALLKPLKRIILAVDNDLPGQRLAQELARRLGPERCYTVQWSSECKDANDVLMHQGAHIVRECIEHAEPWPVQGIVTIDMIRNGITQLYHQGIQRGTSPGWHKVAQHYTVRAGEFTIVTGIPSHGKSQFVSAMMINLAASHGWRFAVFTPEQYPLERYAALLMEQQTGQPFDGAAVRMPPQQMEQAMDWLNASFCFLLPEDEAPTIGALLDLAKVQVYRMGIKGLIIDPWNEIEHSRPSHMTETEYISQTLTQIRRFARIHGVHVWIVVHPTKMTKAVSGAYAGQYPPPSPYDISGSSHWRNKADNCLTLWRDVEAGDGHVELHVQKVRYREIGHPGKIDLWLEKSCGRYNEFGPEGAEGVAD